MSGQIIGKVVDKIEKENILRNLACKLDIDCENVVAVGDGANDLDMLNTAGIGIAWNANSFVRKNVNWFLICRVCVC